MCLKQLSIQTFVSFSVSPRDMQEYPGDMCFIETVFLNRVDLAPNTPHPLKEGK